MAYFDPSATGLTRELDPLAMQLNSADILECWRNCCQKLYIDPDEIPGKTSIPAEQETNISIEQIEQTIPKMRNNKAPGPAEDGWRERL